MGDEATAHDDEPGPPRRASRGRTFVYVLPCRDEDILKVGFSRDPLQRLRTLHRRYFDFFDLERALLIDAGNLRNARWLERQFITGFAMHRAPAPLVVREAAAGFTEWFRGVADPVDRLARELGMERGFELHAPLSAWLRGRFAEWSDLLYGWSERMLEAIEYEHFNLPPQERHRHAARVLRDAIDAYVALGMDVRERLPAPVLAWYERPGACDLR